MGRARSEHRWARGHVHRTGRSTRLALAVPTLEMCHRAPAAHAAALPHCRPERAHPARKRASWRMQYPWAFTRGEQSASAVPRQPDTPALPPRTSDTMTQRCVLPPCSACGLRPRSAPPHVVTPSVPVGPGMRVSAPKPQRRPVSCGAAPSHAHAAGTASLSQVRACARACERRVCLRVSQQGNVGWRRAGRRLSNCQTRLGRPRRAPRAAAACP